MSSQGPSYSDAIQMIQMLQMLEDSANRSLRIDTIAERLEVHRRTIFRYVEALNAAVDNEFGEPIVARVGVGKMAQAQLARRAQPLSSRIFQFAAIHAAVNTLTAGGGSVLGDSADALRQNLEVGLDDAIKPLARRVYRSFFYVAFGPKDYRAREDVLDLAVQGLLRRHPLKIRYRTADGHKMRRVIEPYTLVMYRDGLYLLARDVPRRGAPRKYLYAIDRISAADLDRKTTFTVPMDFDPAEEFAGCLGLWQADEEPETIRIAFDADVAPAAKERQWPGNNGWTEIDNGRSVLELSIPITPEVLTWIITWAESAEVLAPDSLRTEIRDRLRAAAAQYGP